MDDVVEITSEDLTEEQKRIALIHYAKQLTNLKRYNITHREEINEKAKKSYRKIRENPELYEAYKQRKRELYKSKKINNNTLCCI